MRTIRSNSARVSFDGFDGFVEVAYSGLVTAQTFLSMREGVLGTTSHAPVLVFRLDKMLDLIEDFVPPSNDSFKIWMPPAAVIVRRDQFAKHVAYNRQVSALGVMRAVWLDSHAALAYEWALRSAKPQGLRNSPSSPR